MKDLQRNELALLVFICLMFVGYYFLPVLLWGPE